MCVILLTSPHFQPTLLAERFIMPEIKHVKITVLLQPDEFDRFDAFCKEMGYKKSPLVARLIRDYLNNESGNNQISMNEKYEKRS